MHIDQGHSNNIVLVRKLVWIESKRCFEKVPARLIKQSKIPVTLQEAGRVTITPFNR